MGDNRIADELLYEAIKSGTIDFWVIPDSQGLTLQAPARE